VVRFIGVRHENPELAAPFLQIMAAFKDLERGLDPPLFSGANRANPTILSGGLLHYDESEAAATGKNVLSFPYRRG